MSPEQVAGDCDLDGRADEYSLACALYEMLSPLEGGPNPVGRPRKLSKSL